jgi:acetyl-CoA carboxylase biotin carboxylase subunit
MFQRILIANRGEIALRVIRACKELGVETVAVYSEADRGAHYLDLADEKYCIGPASASESYLRVDRIIAAAEVGNVEAIHPGYGFLAENADFAEQCRASQIEFIGPPHQAMALLGDKVAAKKMALEAKVPTVPGSDGLVESEEEAVKIANKIGYPVLIKATAGGGGKGIRPASNEITLRTELKNAAAEAMKAFKNAGVYIEKYIQKPRHVEVQIIGDSHGNVFHLWERDCTMQRKHQKLIEESPAPKLPQSVREDICKAAVRLVKSAGYYNAGTCEFLVDQDHQFYFIEVNARIQVEHPVSESVTGIDLIQSQIRVAAGEKLDLKQRSIPCNNFRPCPGKITRLRLPGGPGVRFDSHVYEGYTISPYYDSMIGKLIVHRPTREEAIRTAVRALNEFVIDGIQTTIPLAKRILEHNTFQTSAGDTGFVERTF